MPKIRFLPYEVEVEALPDESILETAMRCGVYIDALCGGMGSCNKCKIIVEEGTVKGEKIEDKYYKACRTYPLSDITVRIPFAGEIDKRVLLRKPRKRAQGITLERKEPVNSPFSKLFLEIEPPTIEDNTSDWLRVRRALETHNIFRPEISLSFLQKLPRVLREKDFKVTFSLYHEPVDDKYYLVDVESGDKRKENLGVAIDIGTTTLQLELIDLNTGEVLVFTSDYNPQISYGEDVISRIVFARKKEGLKLLAQKIREKLGELIEELVKKANRRLEEINLVSIGANTVMCHLFLEIEPKFLREYPYVPATIKFPPIPAKEVGLPLKDGVFVQLAPCVASYVGGDITAGVVASRIAEEAPLTLFIDLGTNGEIVVGNKDFLICAACSAGPAFEGGGIKFGMRATLGAIESVNIDPVTFEPMVLTIGKRKPRGLCGSGIISLLANLFRSGLIDKAGKYNRNIKHPRLREGEEGWEYVVVWKEHSALNEDIVFTEADIENLIRAKGAMFAGYQILLESIGLSVSDIERVYLAGTFGTYIDIEEAITIGLLPDLPRERFYFLENTSLKGAKFALLYKEDLLKMEKVVNMMTHIELSSYPQYMDYYMAALFLPHTNENLFPSLNKTM